MPVPSSLVAVSTTPASNSPSGAESPITADDYLRTYAAFMKQSVSSGADIASATTITPAATANSFNVTGTTPTTTIASTNSWDGRMVLFVATGAWPLTHSASLILPGAVNYAAAAGDALLFRQESAGVWRCVMATRAAGDVPAGLVTASGLTMNTARVLGRSTAGIGPVEELAAGAFGLPLLATANANAARQSLLQLPAVRQTVLYGPVDANGASAFGGSVGGANLVVSGTLTATAANGVSGDRIGQITNPSFASPTGSGTGYLYLLVNADGTCTTVVRALAPSYRQGGADVVTNGQFTFNYKEMVGKVGNGTVAAQAYEVCIGHCPYTSNNWSGTPVWYALQGSFAPAWQAVSAGSSLTFTHNLGVTPLQWRAAGATSSTGTAESDFVQYNSTPAAGGGWAFNPNSTTISLQADPAAARIAMGSAPYYQAATHARVVVSRGW